VLIIGRPLASPLNTMSNSVCPLIAKTPLGSMLKFSLFVYTNTLRNLIASIASSPSRNYTSRVQSAERRSPVHVDETALQLTLIDLP